MPGLRAQFGRPATHGQGIVEYGLILGLVAVFAVVILVFFSDTVAQVLAAVGAAIDQSG